MTDQILVGRIRLSRSCERSLRGEHDGLVRPDLFGERLKLGREKPLCHLVLVGCIAPIVSHNVKDQPVRVLPEVLDFRIKLLKCLRWIGGLKRTNPQKANVVSAHTVSTGKEGIGWRISKAWLKSPI